MTAAHHAPRPARQVVDTWDQWVDSWTVNLRARSLRPGTIRNYRACMANVVRWARDAGHLDPLNLTRHDIDAWLADAADMTNPRTGEPRKASTTAMEWRTLSVFYAWVALDEDEGWRNPMRASKPPRTVEYVTDVLSDDDLSRLLDTCTGRDYADRRDHAIMRVLLDCGLRRAELLGLTPESVNLAERYLSVGSQHAKGGKARAVPFGHKTAEALSRYLRARARHRLAESTTALWLTDGGNRPGPLGASGVRLLLNRRAAEAGVTNVHPHRFRHTAYDAYASAGGGDRNAMTSFGWDSPTMLGHYGKSAAQRRAMDEGHRLSPGDRV